MIRSMVRLNTKIHLNDDTGNLALLTKGYPMRGNFQFFFLQ